MPSPSDHPLLNLAPDVCDQDWRFVLPFDVEYAGETVRVIPPASGNTFVIDALPNVTPERAEQMGWADQVGPGVFYDYLGNRLRYDPAEQNLRNLLFFEADALRDGYAATGYPNVDGDLIVEMADEALSLLEAIGNEYANPQTMQATPDFGIVGDYPLTPDQLDLIRELYLDVGQLLFCAKYGAALSEVVTRGRARRATRQLRQGFVPEPGPPAVSGAPPGEDPFGGFDLESPPPGAPPPPPPPDDPGLPPDLDLEGEDLEEEAESSQSATPTEDEGLSMGAKIGIGVGVVALVGVATYYLTTSDGKKSRRAAGARFANGRDGLVPNALGGAFLHG